MFKDNTQFRERFNRWKLGELVYDKGRPIDPPEVDGDPLNNNRDLPRYAKGKDDDPIIPAGMLKEVVVTAPRRYFKEYDNNGNPVYTSNYRESLSYLNSFLPKGDIEKRRERWYAQNVGSNGQQRPGLHGYAKDIADITAIGLGGALAPLFFAPIAAGAAPVFNAMARPLSTAVTIGSKIFPKVGNFINYAEMGDRALMATLGAEGAWNTGKAWYNGEIPWYQAAPELAMNLLMTTEATPLLLKGISAGKNFTNGVAKFFDNSLGRTLQPAIVGTSANRADGLAQRFNFSRQPTIHPRQSATYTPLLPQNSNLPLNTNPAFTTNLSIGDIDELYKLSREYDSSNDLISAFKKYLPKDFDAISANRYDIQNALRELGVPVLLKYDTTSKKLKPIVEDLSSVLKSSKRLSRYDYDDLESVLDGPFKNNFLRLIDNLSDEELVELWSRRTGGKGGREYIRRDILPNGGIASFHDGYKRTFDKTQNDFFNTAAKKLTKKYGIDFEDLENYDKIAEFLRFSKNSPYNPSIHPLPGDVRHMYWFLNEKNNSEGAMSAIKDLIKLRSSMPRGSAVTEYNTSPDSYTLELIDALKSYSSNPKDVGKTGITWLKDGFGKYIMDDGNNLQRDKLTIESLINDFKASNEDEKLIQSFERYLELLQSASKSIGDDYAFRTWLKNNSNFKHNSEFDLFILNKANDLKNRTVSKVNERLKKARDITGIKDIPDASISNIEKYWNIDDYLFHLGLGYYAPFIRRPNIQVVKYKNGKDSFLIKPKR